LGHRVRRDPWRREGEEEEGVLEEIHGNWRETLASC
jgi:hypothetical protein